VDNPLFAKEQPLSLPGVWQKILSAIHEQLQDETFERWFAPCKLKEQGSDELTLEVPSVFYKNWILEHFGDFIQKSLTNHGLPDTKLAIHIAGDNEATTTSSTAPRRRHSSRSSPVRPSSNNGSKLNPKYTFDNFVEGSCNRYARATCLAAAQAPGRAYNPIFIYAGVGLGKTHLMQAVGHQMLSHLQGVKIHYVSSESFTNHLIHCLQKRTMDYFRRCYRDVNALLIDDIHFLSGKETTQEEFFHTFNTLSDLHSQIIVSSDRPPTDLAAMEERLISRFQSGIVVDLQTPDLETRVAILLNLARNLRLSLPEDVAFFIAEKARLNVRQLEGALLSVAAYASLLKQPPNLSFAQHALKNLLLQDAQHKVTIEQIQKKVAEHFDIRLGDMTGRRRPKTIAFPRQVAMHLCRELTAHSLHEIGEAFGGRNHATVIYAHNLVQERSRRDLKLSLLVSRLRQELSRL
jgi:chromosomal replication initiator protein